MGRAAAVAEQRARQIDKSISIVNTAIKSLGAGLVVGLTLDTVRTKIEAVIQSAAGLQQISERTGATVEGLSALSSVAKLSNTDTESLATGLQKLAKSMNDAEHGGVKNVEAFRSIGISIDELKGQKPDETFLLISKRLAEYADGAGKTALAQQLLGKAGANLLPVAKDLADIGEYQTKVTREQAAVADEYEKNLKRIEMAQNAVYKVVAFQVIPVMDAFTVAMLEAIKGSNGLKSTADDLANSNSIQEFAIEGAKALGFLVDAFDVMARSALITLKVVGGVKDIFKAANSGQSNNAGLGEAIQKGVFADIDKILSRDQFSSILTKRLDAMSAAGRVAASAWGREGRGGATAQRGEVNFNPNKAPRGAMEPKDDAGLKMLEGELKAQEAFIASEKAQLQTREQYLQHYYSQEYLNANQFYTSKTMLIQDALKAELEAYDKEASAIATYALTHTKKTEQQDIENRQAEVTRKRNAAQLEASKQQVAVIQEQDGIYRQFALTTTEVARQATLSNNAAQFQIDLLGKGTLEILRATEAKRIQLAVEERIRQLRKEGGPQSLIETAIAEAEAQKAAAIDMVTKSYEKQRTIAFGASEAFRKYAEDATNTGAHIEAAMTNAFTGMEDALVNFVTTGKLSFTSLANSIVADITRIIVKQQIVAPLAASMQGGMNSGDGVFGFLGGGIGKLFGGGIGTGAALSGGISATYAAGTDFVPHDMVAQIHKGERIIPAAQNRPGAMGNTVNVTVNQSFAIGTTRTTTLQAAVDARRQLEFAGRNL